MKKTHSYYFHYLLLYLSQRRKSYPRKETHTLIASGSIDFTIGEVVIDTGTDGTNDLTQGFHQTNWNFLGVEDFAPNYEAIIFPNPTEDVLNIKTSMFENVTYTLYDGLGKLVMQDILSAEQTPIQVSQLAPGVIH